MSEVKVSLVAHADWSINARKRWCAYAVREDRGLLRAYAPHQVVQPEALLHHLRQIAGASGCILVGFDFPIGLPRRYAEKASITGFLAWLEGLGKGDWSDFTRVAGTPEEISLYRPFYPSQPGGSSRQHLTSRLGFASFSDLLRECERAHPGRRAACPLFWTLGGQQVGKAALSGWKELLLPALLDQEIPRLDSALDRSYSHRFSIWPFSGTLESLLEPGSSVVVEVYPAEFYRRLGVQFSARGTGGSSGKRSKTDREKQAQPLFSWVSQINLALDPALEQSIRDGFGSSADGEDRFDAVIGLFGMLDVLSQGDPFFEPAGAQVREVEGWIFGQDPGPENSCKKST